MPELEATNNSRTGGAGTREEHVNATRPAVPGSTYVRETVGVETT